MQATSIHATFTPMTDQVKRLTDEARKLSADERAALIEQLWDTLPPETAAVPFPDWHRAGLDARLAEHEADPASVVPWEEARVRLASRKKP